MKEIAIILLSPQRFVNGTRLDDRLIRVDWDAGFIEGRQYGRGKTGGQVRDEYRTDYDAGRGGYGKLLSQKIATPITASPTIRLTSKPPQLVIKATT